MIKWRSLKNPRGWRTRETKSNTLKATPMLSKKSSTLSTERYINTPVLPKKDSSCQTPEIELEHSAGGYYTNEPLMYSPIKPMNLEQQMNLHRRAYSGNYPQASQWWFLPKIVPVAITNQLCPGWNGVYSMNGMLPACQQNINHDLTAQKWCGHYDASTPQKFVFGLDDRFVNYETILPTSKA